MYVLLFCFWLILNGKLTLEICLLGLALTAAVGALCWALFDYTPRREARFLRRAPLFVCYVLVLVWEIVKASLVMMSFILNEKKTTEPVLVTFSSGLRTRFGRFILANSITLTPGTITVEVQDDVFTVHCLRRDFLDVSEGSTFIRWIRRLEGEA